METVQDPTRSTIDSKTPQYNVSCQTCRISRTFVTLQGANAFFDEHEGHKVIEGRLFERPQIAKKPDVIAEEASKPQVEKAPEVVAGSGDTIAQELSPQVKEGPDVAVRGEAQAPLRQVLQSAEVQVKEVAAAEVREIVPVPLPQMVPSAEVQPKEPIAAALPLLTEAPAPLPQVTQSAEMQLEVPISAALAPLSEKDLEEPLLLARSSYIGESAEKRTDALKVSRALKEFKWNVEPPYVIGIMVDDNLSVETNIGVISSSMVERVEKEGYKFVAVNTPQGSPVAWFKKESQQALEMNSPVGGAETMMQISEGKRTYDKDKAVWHESFVSLLMTVKDMDGEKLKRVTNIIRSEWPEPDIHS